MLAVAVRTWAAPLHSPTGLGFPESACQLDRIQTAAWRWISDPLSNSEVRHAKPSLAGWLPEVSSFCQNPIVHSCPLFRVWSVRYGFVTDILGQVTDILCLAKRVNVFSIIPFLGECHTCSCAPPCVDLLRFSLLLSDCSRGLLSRALGVRGRDTPPPSPPAGSGPSLVLIRAWFTMLMTKHCLTSPASLPSTRA